MNKIGRRVNPKLKIVQKPVGLHYYQHDFFHKHQDFKPDKFCRDAIDEQIKIIDPQFWSEVEKQVKDEKKT